VICSDVCATEQTAVPAENKNQHLRLRLEVLQGYDPQPTPEEEIGFQKNDV